MSTRPDQLMAMPSYLAGHVYKLVREPMRRTLAEHGLVPPQLALLCTLDEFGPCSQQELCDRLELDKSNVVKLLDGLEQLGHATRSPSPADRRRYDVAITTRGRRLARRVAAAARDDQDELLAASLAGDERAAVVELLARVIDAYDAQRART